MKNIIFFCTILSIFNTAQVFGQQTKIAKTIDDFWSANKQDVLTIYKIYRSFNANVGKEKAKNIKDKKSKWNIGGSGRNGAYSYKLVGSKEFLNKEDRKYFEEAISKGKALRVMFLVGALGTDKGIVAKLVFPTKFDNKQDNINWDKDFNYMGGTVQTYSIDEKEKLTVTCTAFNKDKSTPENMVRVEVESNFHKAVFYYSL